MRIVLLGPPGSGKATLAERIAEHCAVPVLTAQNVLTRAAAEESELGRLARDAVDTNRASDELLLALLRMRLAQPDLAVGFVLVDFPRNAAQADVLEGMLDCLGRPLDLVLYITVDPDELMERLVGRIHCEHCGAEYNLYVNPPTVEGVCDNCGARVNRRPGDYEETISNRLRIYEGLTGPLTQYYGLHGKLRKVSGDGRADTVWRTIREIIDGTARTLLQTAPVSEPAVSIDAMEQASPATAKPQGKRTNRASAGSQSDTGMPVEAKKALRPGKKAAPESPAAQSVTKAKAGKSAESAGAGTGSAVAHRPASKKTAVKPAATKKAVSKKPAAAKKTVAKKAAAKPAAPQQATNKKAAPKHAAPKKATPSKTAPKQAPEKTAPGKRTVAKPAAVKKAVAKKAGPKTKTKAAVKRTASKPAAAKKAVAKKAAPKNQTAAKKKLRG